MPVPPNYIDVKWPILGTGLHIDAWWPLLRSIGHCLGGHGHWSPLHGRCSPELRCFTFLPLISSTSPPRPLGCNENPLISTRGNEMSTFWGFHTKISVDLKDICWSSYNLYEEQRRRLLLIRFRESEVWWIHSESRNLNADNSTWIDNKNVILSRQKVSGLSKIIWSSKQNLQRI